MIHPDPNEAWDAITEAVSPLGTHVAQAPGTGSPGKSGTVYVCKGCGAQKFAAPVALLDDWCGPCVRAVLDAVPVPNPTATPQPTPTPGQTAVLPLVIADLEARAVTGEQKYGILLQVENGRDHLMDAYQEALDLVMYLRAAVERRKQGPTP